MPVPGSAKEKARLGWALGSSVVGAREEILAAARRLVDRGRSTFSPAELIAAAREAGCKYPDTTLRTQIITYMCTSSSLPYGTKYRDLVRVARGSYRLATEEERGVGAPRVSPRAPAPATRTAPELALEESPADEGWFAEARIQSEVVRHLAAEGWDITRVASTATREHGIDIEAERAGQRLLVEVKGYPDATYRSGPRAGERKPHGVGAQARTYFGNALLAGLLMRADHPEASVVLAFPDFETYRTLASRTRPPLAAARIDVWLVGPNGSVQESAG